MDYFSALAEFQKPIKTEMEDAYILDVPLEVGLGTGSDWLEAH